MSQYPEPEGGAAIPVAGPGKLDACPESGLTMSEDSSTASKALAGTCLSSWMSDGGQDGSAEPPKYQLLPLSARMSPYCCIARRITCACGENPLMSKLALRRNRAPMGGKLGSERAPASWRAGQR